MFKLRLYNNLYLESLVSTSPDSGDTSHLLLRGSRHWSVEHVPVVAARGRRLSERALKGAVLFAAWTTCCLRHAHPYHPALADECQGVVVRPRDARQPAEDVLESLAEPTDRKRCNVK